MLRPPQLELRLSSRRTNVITTTAVGGLLLVLAAFQIYYRVYTGYPIYDSEGSTLLNARNLFQGHRLYDQIYSLYGPFYYMLQWLIHAITGSPETLDGQRLVSGSYWLLSEGLFFWLILRLTKSALAAAFAFVVMMQIFPYMAQEPGHPQEFCTIAIGAVLIAATYLQGPRQSVALGTMAFFIAGLALSKVNAGLFVFTAAGLAFLSATQNSFLRIYVFWALAIGSLLVPALLMRPLLDMPWAIAYCIFSTCAIAIAIWLAHNLNRYPFITLKAWCIFALLLAAFAILPVLFFYLRGTTLWAMLNLTVLQQKGFAITWNVPLKVRLTFLQLALSFVPVIVAYVYVKQTRNGTGHWDDVLPLLKFLAGVTILYLLYRGNYAALLKTSPAYLWMIPVLPSGEQGSKSIFPRTFLCLLCAFHLLYAFPCAGSQVNVAAVPLLVAEVVLLADSLQWAAKRYLTISRVRTAAITAALVGLVSLSVWQTMYWRNDYQSLTSLGLPGSTRIHTNSTDVETYRYLVSSINSKCSTFYTMPGLFGFNLWTQKLPPTTFNADAWMLVMSAEQQRRVVKDLSQASGMCLIYCPKLVEFWLRDHRLGPSPLAEYAMSHFSVADEKNGYLLMVPNP